MGWKATACTVPGHFGLRSYNPIVLPRPGQIQTDDETHEEGGRRGDIERDTVIHEFIPAWLKDGGQTDRISQLWVVRGSLPFHVSQGKIPRNLNHPSLSSALHPKSGHHGEGCYLR